MRDRSSSSGEYTNALRAQITSALQVSRNGIRAPREVDRALPLEEQPLVSVVTPVYNGEEFLADCIESVLAQTYQNWELTIINNRSTDRTLEIAESYATKERRIRVNTNDQFLPIIGNHNAALRQISPQSKYCKVVFADDWLFSQCLMEMVKVAEKYPSVGMVGAYGLDGIEVLWQGLPYPRTFVSGLEMGRETLLGGPYVFGTPSSLLLRSDLVRARESFYNESNLHADYEASFEVLREADFGFVHQVLTYSRPRAESHTATALSLESYILGNLGATITHGPVFLPVEQYEDRKEYWMKKYYRVLAKSFLRLRGKEFWHFHQRRLRELDHQLDRSRLAKAVGREVIGSITRPLDALDGVMKWWSRAGSRVWNQRARQ